MKISVFGTLGVVCTKKRKNNAFSVDFAYTIWYYYEAHDQNRKVLYISGYNDTPGGVYKKMKGEILNANN